MEHLTDETLARLVDEAPDSNEERHLRACVSCRDELDAMVQQTHGLAQLPADEIPHSELGWAELEGILREEGILTTASGTTRPRTMVTPSSSPAWMRMAAAFLLFALGGVVGWGVRGGVLKMGAEDGGSEVAVVESISVESGHPVEVVSLAGDEVGESASARVGFEGAAPAILPSNPIEAEEPPLTSESSPVSYSGTSSEGAVAFLTDLPYQSSSLEEAESVVRLVETVYFEALAVYRDLLSGSGLEAGGDPVSRYVALGNVLAITEEAIRSAPTDPFLNGLLINTLVERDAVGRGITMFAAGQ